jgi:hypothetical protein
MLTSLVPQIYDKFTDVLKGLLELRVKVVKF